MLAGGESKIAAEVLHEVLDFGDVFSEIFNGLSSKNTARVQLQLIRRNLGGVFKGYKRYIYATYIFTLKSSVEKLCVSNIYTYTYCVCIYVLLVKGVLTEMLF